MMKIVKFMLWCFTIGFAAYLNSVANTYQNITYTSILFGFVLFKFAGFIYHYPVKLRSADVKSILIKFGFTVGLIIPGVSFLASFTIALLVSFVVNFQTMDLELFRSYMILLSIFISLLVHTFKDLWDNRHMIDSVRAIKIKNDQVEWDALSEDEEELDQVEPTREQFRAGMR